MEKTEIKSKMNEVIAKIKANSKDAKYAGKLIESLLSLKGKSGIEPTLIHLPISEVIEKIEGETYRICLCKSGEVVYHMKGGMDIVVQPKANSLYTYLSDMIGVESKLDELSEEDRALFMDDVIASTYVLNIPFFAFGDLDLKYKLANFIIDYLEEFYGNAIENTELQDETPIENAMFEEAVLELDSITNDAANEEDNIS